MGKRATAGWGSRIGSVLILAVVGGLAALPGYGAAERLGRATFMMMRGPSIDSVVPVIVLLGSMLIVAVAAALACRLSGLGGLTLGAATFLVTTFTTTGQPYLSTAIRDLLSAGGPAVRAVAMVLLIGTSLLPVAAVLLGLGAASTLASRRSRSSGPALLVVLALTPALVWAVTWSGTRVRMQLGAVTFGGSQTSPAILGPLVLAVVAALGLAAIVALGGRGAWGLAGAGLVIGVVGVVFPILAGEMFRLGILPGWAVRSFDMAAVATTPVVGALLLGGGLGLVWRSRAAAADGSSWPASQSSASMLAGVEGPRATAERPRHRA